MWACPDHWLVSKKHICKGSFQECKKEGILIETTVRGTQDLPEMGAGCAEEAGLIKPILKNREGADSPNQPWRWVSGKGQAVFPHP